MVSGYRDGDEEDQFGRLRATGYDARPRLLQVRLDDDTTLQYSCVGENNNHR
jgi:hypothetical protein